MITRRSFLAACGSALAIVAFPFKTFAKKPVARPRKRTNSKNSCLHAGKIVGICPCCGSEDIELEESHMIPRHYEHVFGCKSCKAEFALQATITVSKWPEFVPPWHAGKIVGICPCCDSEDIELEESHMIPRHYKHVFGCKSCKAEFALQATITVSKWPGIE